MTLLPEAPAMREPDHEDAETQWEVLKAQLIPGYMYIYARRRAAELAAMRRHRVGTAEWHAWQREAEDDDEPAGLEDSDDEEDPAVTRRRREAKWEAKWGDENWLPQESREPWESRPLSRRAKLHKAEMVLHTLPQEKEGSSKTAKVAAKPGSLSAKAAAKVGSRRMKLRRGITVDSGASANVMPKRMLRKQKMRPSPGSRRGAHYLAANNGRIANEGECDFKFRTIEGNEQNITFQIAEVNKALGSVSYLVDNGYRVVFDQDEATGHDVSMMIHKATGVISRFRRERNIWILDAIVDDEEPDNGFPRHA